jgi:hypothetical protein
MLSNFERWWKSWWLRGEPSKHSTCVYLALQLIVFVQPIPVSGMEQFFDLRQLLCMRTRLSVGAFKIEPIIQVAAPKHVIKLTAQV